MLSTKFILTTLAVFFSATSSTNALGCFSGGLTWNDVTDDQGQLNDFRSSACNGAFQGTYNAGVERNACKTFSSGNRVNLKVKNVSGVQKTLSASDCISALTIEMNACSHGSIQQHPNGVFEYTDDPNAGAC